MTDADATEKAIRPNTKLVWIETPTNPMLKIIDIDAVTKISRAKRGTDVLVLVDNTFASPYLQSPLELGADIVLHSLSKYVGGHSDVIGGALIVKDKTLYESLFFSAKSIGANPSAFDSYLVLRGMKTLEARMKLHCKNAYILAKWMESHPLVDKVIYPGLESHPNHKLAKT